MTQFSLSSSRIFTFLGGVAVLAGLSAASNHIALNSAALNTLNQLTDTEAEPVVFVSQEEVPTGSVCAQYWYQGHLDLRAGKVLPENNSWSEAIICEPLYIPFVAHLIPADLAWAEFAVAAQPGSAEAWFWLGNLDPDHAVEYYQKGLSIDPSDPRRWLTFGGLLHETQPEEALQAYLEACLRGDPGYNACMRAGDMANQLGKIELAIQYYRYSQWPPISRMADDLEAALQGEDAAP